MIIIKRMRLYKTCKVLIVPIIAKKTIISMFHSHITITRNMWIMDCFNLKNIIIDSKPLCQYFEINLSYCYFFSQNLRFINTILTWYEKCSTIFIIILFFQQLFKFNFLNFNQLHLTFHSMLNTNKSKPITIKMKYYLSCEKYDIQILR